MKNLTALQYVRDLLGHKVKMTEKQALQQLINSHKRLRKDAINRQHPQVDAVLAKAENLAKTNLKDILNLVGKTSDKLKNYKNKVLKEAMLNVLENILENYVSEDLKKQLKINRETAKFEFK